MAKTVQPIAIELGIKGGEKLAALNRSFRDLSKQVKLSDADITQATKDIVTFATKAGNSEATIKGQIKAFEGLREQAALGGKAYTELTQGISKLQSTLRGSSAAVEAKRKSLVELGSSANATTTQIQSAIKALTVLRGETRLDSEAFNAFGQSIDRLAERFEKVNQEAQDFANAQARSGRVISASSGAAKQQIKDLDLVTQALREQREELGRLEGEARIRRGVADLAERGAVSSSRRSYQEALAESVLSGTSLRELLSTKDIRAALAEVELQIAELQKQVETKLSRGMQISFQEIARSARESARAMAAAFADPEFLNVLSRLDERIGTLPNTTAGYSQRLRELEQQLANTDRSSENYRRVSEEISKVQKELAKDVYGYSEALEQLAVSQENAARRAEKLRGIGEYVASVSGLGATAAAGRAGTPMVGAIGGYRDPATGAMIATGRGMRRDRMAYQESQELEKVASAQGDLEQAFDRAIETYRSSLQTIQDLQAKRHEEFMSQVAAEDAAQKKAFQEQQSREEREYQRRVAIGRQMRTGEFASRRLIGMPNQELSQLYGGIVRIGQADQMRQLEMMGRGYDEVANDIRKVTATSNGSVSSLNAQRSAWSNLRDILDPASQQFKEVTREIERVDKALEKTQRRRRGMSPMQMTQAAGAAISGGIFGGPEGFLGGAIGAIGGVGGAFAGAAIGAQVGGLRRQLGEFADYAAGIQKLQIALRGVAGSQDEFNRAMAAASSVTKELNVPQDVAIQGMTRLTAAVKGAGGGVADAELAFKNINSAIIATGGGAEQVEGAVTALVQIFSKGKVSAEEINQIAERLPGTFNKIAAASGRTGPELTKALQDGKVGLNDLMKFLVQLGDDYGKLAEKIAASSESAGARLQVAYDKMRQEVGKALQPIGAEFQAAFTEFIEDITPSLVSAAKAVGDGLRFIIQNKEAIAALAGFAAKMIAANLAMKAFVAFNGPIKAMLASLVVNFGSASSAASFATKRITALRTALGGLLRFAAVTIAIDIVVNGMQKLAEVEARMNAIAKSSTKTYAESIGGSAASKKEIEALIKENRAEYERRKSELESVRFPLLTAQDEIAKAAMLQLNTRLAQLQTMRERAVYETPEQRADADLRRLTDFAEPDLDGNGEGGAKAARDAERIKQQLAQIKLQGDAIERSKALLNVNTEIRENARQIIFAQTENNTQKAYALRQDAISLEFLKKDLEIQLDYQKAVEAAALEENAQIRAAQLQLAEKQRIFAIEENINNAINDRIGLVQENTIELKKQAEALEDARFGLREQLGMVDLKERVARAQEKFKQQYPGATAEDLDLIRQQIDPTPFESMRQNITRLKEELKELVDPVNQITGAANAIGTSFADSFKSVISGSATAQEALAGFFRNIANYFLDMAAQIIQKMIVMYVLNTLVGLLPGARYGSGMGSKPGIPGSVSPQGLPYYGPAFAKGGIMTEDGPMPLRTYARGGIARSPQLAMFGEGSMPEAYVPLPDGRSIPVTMRGSAGVQVDTINITIENTGEQLTPAAQKQLARQVQGIVLSTLANERRSGGML
jgi:tape measure domain-containing protein